MTDVARTAFPQARAAMLARVAPLPIECVALADAFGRVVARTYRADADLVPFARSAMDGYALRAADTDGADAGAPRVLPVVGTTFAGDGASRLAPGTACAITTGAMIPAGADAVVPYEDIERDGASIVLSAPLAALDHVFEPGDDAKRGETLIAAGTLVGPGQAALLAAAGVARVDVHRRPRVAIVSTGDEIVAVDAMPQLGQIRTSNATMLAAAIAADGGTVVCAEHAADDRAVVRATLERALVGADLVITTGGASAGERDFVKAVLRDLGAEFAFDSVALRPAKPTAFATLGSAAIAVLPGNPAAAYVAYVALVRGAVRRMYGYAEPYPAAIDATLRGEIHAKPNRHFVMFASLTYREGRLEVSPLANQCSSLVRTSADANVFVIVPPGAGSVLDGALVRCEPVRGDTFVPTR
ncbi:MAG: molybdopterin molybdotransferase MoeA [Vulcanimicrobiaceae bacterium]